MCCLFYSIGDLALSSSGSPLCTLPAAVYLGFSPDGLRGIWAVWLVLGCWESPFLLSPGSTSPNFIFPEFTQTYVLALKKTISWLHIFVYWFNFFIISLDHLLLMIILHLLEKGHLGQQSIIVLPSFIIYLFFRSGHIEVVMFMRLLGLLHSRSGRIVGIQLNSINCLSFDLLQLSPSQSALNELSLYFLIA